MAPAKVISTSYGYNEADLTPAYERRQCQEYQKLGLLGTTFVYASGVYHCFNSPAYPFLLTIFR